MALTDNLTAYYKLDGNSNDSLGTYNGTDSNISYNASYGKISQGADFNGSNSKITTGNYFATGASAKSFSHWVYSHSTSDRGWTIYGGTDSDKQAFGMFVEANDFIFFGNAGGDYNFYTDTYTANTWYHIVCTYDGTTVRAYVNGSLIGSGAAKTLNTGNGNAIQFGARVGDANGWFDGYVDEIGIWSRELTSTEVTTLYNGGAGLSYPFTTTAVKSVNGLAKASVKSKNGLAIASIKSFNGLA